MVAYSRGKNATHGVKPSSRVLLTAAASWDPSLGDLFSTLAVGATLCVAPRSALLHHLAATLRTCRATHVCTTPALWLVSSPTDRALVSPRAANEISV